MIIWEFIEKGGPIMWPLIIAAIAATYLIIYKSLHIVKLSKYYKKDDTIEEVRLLTRKKKYEDAKELLDHDGPCEKILSKGVDYIEEKFPEDAIKDRLEMIYEEEIHTLEKGLPIILILGEIMPMLGLLGTVSGMIQVFKAITTYGTGDAQALAGGISEALLTTEVGLVLAIPTMFCYTLLNSEIDSITKQMRQAGSTIVTVSRVINKKVKK